MYVYVYVYEGWPISPILVEIEIEIGIGIPALVGIWSLSTAQTSLPSWVGTATVPGFSCPNPISRPFDTETDSAPDPDLASP